MAWGASEGAIWYSGGVFKRGWVMFAVVVLSLAATGRAVAQERTFPPRPLPGVFVVDEAGLLDADSVKAINQRSGTLLAEKKIPVYVVTVANVERYDPVRRATVDEYAHALFDEWGIGFTDYNYGVLLLVSSGDRRARIELGAGWKREYDPYCRQIMDDLIVPRFKVGRFNQGIVSGVEGLDAMARGEAIPTRGFGASTMDKVKELTGSKGFVNCVILVLAVVGGLVSRGFNRYFYGTWDSPFGSSSGSDSDSGGGGGWGGGGGFGGGSSGGGGASGSW